MGDASAAHAGPAGLTTRELDVVRLVADGLTDKAIAAQLHVGTHGGDHVARPGEGAPAESDAAGHVGAQACSVAGSVAITHSH